MPLALLISWHDSNTLYPNDDAGNYLETAQDIYLKYESSGLLKGCEAAYLERGWRPILFPVLAVPGLIVSGGSIRSTVLLTMSISYFLVLTYAYLLSRKFLPPEHSLICTVILGTTSWIIQYTHLFYSEMWVIACAMASVYHLSKSEFFCSLPHSILSGLWLALAISIRPVETFMSLAIGIGCFVYLSWKRRKISLRDLSVTAFTLLLTCVILGAGVLSSISIKILAIPLAAVLLGSGALLFCTKSMGLTLPYLAAFWAANFLASLWWFPAIKNLYAWIYETSLGSMIHLYSGEGRLSLLGAMSTFFAFLGGYPLLVIVSLAALAVLLAAFQGKPVRAWGPPMAAALTTVVIPLSIVAMSAGSDFRRAFVGFSFLFLTSSIVAIHPGSPLAGIRFAVLSAMAFLQVLVVVTTTFGVLPDAHRLVTKAFKPSWPPFKGGDPSEKFFEAIKDLPLGGTAALFSLSIHTPMDRPFDAPLVNVLAKKSQSKVCFFGYPWNFIDLKEGYEALVNDCYSWVFVDITTDVPESMKTKDPYSRLTVDLIQRCRTSRLEEVGLALISELNISNKAIWLLQVKHPGDMPLSFEDNVASSRNGGVAGATSSHAEYPAPHLNDGTDAAWGSEETGEDTIFYVTRRDPYKARLFKLVLFSPRKEGHLRDLSVVATSADPDAGTTWRTIKSRLSSSDPFEEKISLPNEKDRTVVTVELDASDANWMAYKTFGLACFSATRSYRRNYVSLGRGVYVRELQILAEPSEK